MSNYLRIARIFQCSGDCTQSLCIGAAVLPFGRFAALEHPSNDLAALVADKLLNIGWLYRDALGIPQDYAAAMRWYRLAADKGSPKAMTNIGWLYENGLGVNQDYAAALRWYSLAADKGEPNAMNAIGILYEQGLGVTQNSIEAAQWYRLAADNGLPEGMTNIGGALAWGMGTNKDCSAARVWLSKAATLHSQRADNWLQNDVDGQCQW